MKKIIQAYGGFLLSGIVVVLLMVLIFETITDNEGNRGIFQIVGAHLNTESQDYNTYQDFDMVEVESQKAAPEIVFDGSSAIYAGAVFIMNYMRAIDFSGHALPVKVLEIKDPVGNDVTAAYQADSGLIDFAVSGIYKMKVYAIDSENRKTVSEIAVPVNE